MLRFNPKGFAQERLVDGKWVLGVRGVRRVPYLLPELLAAPKEETVFIVEGEKDADGLTLKLGMVATTSAGGVGGAAQWTDPKFSEPFRGRRVVVLPDNDPPGQKYAEQVALALSGIAADLRVVLLPLPEKGDVSDLIDGGYRKKELQELIEKTGAARFDVKPSGVSLVRMSDVAAEDVSWLWPGRIPPG